MSKEKAQRGQNVFDLALRAYGAPEGALFLALDNNLPAWELRTGQELEVREAPLNKEIKEHYQNNNIRPATGQ